MTLRLLLTDGDGVQGLTATFGAFINTSISDAAASAAAAANSANAAAASATNASNGATAAATSASQAATSATGAATSATNASNSATAASGSASAASTSATNAANSASAAATSASSASTSATNAANSATSAATSASNAAATLANAVLVDGSRAMAGDLNRSDVATAYRAFGYTTSGSLRWNHGASGQAETGGNAGSNWILQRFSDAGAAIDIPLTVIRATGQLSTSVRPVFAGNTPYDSGNLPGTSITWTAAQAFGTISATTATIGTLGGALSAGGNGITNAANPTNAQDVTTKNYVDGQDLFYAQRQPDLIINPHGSIQQETTAPISITAAAQYFADQWLGNSAGTTFVYQLGVTTGSVSNFDPCYMFAKTTTIKSSLAAGDAATLGTRIEGRVLRRLLYGGASAKSSWIRFRASATQSATISVAVRNAANNRSYVTTFAITATPTDYSFQLPGDTTGTWPTDNSQAAELSFTFAAGTTFQTSTLNAWQAGNFVAANTQSNQLDTSNRQMNITDVSWRDSTILLPFTPIDYELEAIRAQRYFTITTVIASTSTSTGSGSWIAPVRMRANPTLTAAFNAGSGATYSMLSFGGSDTNGNVGFFQTANHSQVASAAITLNARM